MGEPQRLWNGIELGEPTTFTPAPRQPEPEPAPIVIDTRPRVTPREAARLTEVVVDTAALTIGKWVAFWVLGGWIFHFMLIPLAIAILVVIGAALLSLFLGLVWLMGGFEGPTRPEPAKAVWRSVEWPAGAKATQSRRYVEHGVLHHLADERDHWPTYDEVCEYTVTWKGPGGRDEKRRVRDAFENGKYKARLSIQRLE